MESQDEALSLAHVAQELFSGGIDYSNVAQFREDVTNLATHLQSRFEAKDLPAPVAQSIAKLLFPWSEAVREAATQNVSTSQSQPILAQIATSRNIVEKVLTPPESCLPREINDLFLLLDRWLLKPHQRERKKVIPEVDKLHTYLDMMVISDMGKKVINDKLLTFGEWTDTWSDKSKEKMVVLDKIHECKEVMAKKLREEWSQVPVNPSPRTEPQDKALSLAHVAQELFSGGIDYSNVAQFREDVTNLATHLQSRFEAKDLPAPVAQSIAKLLFPWSEAVREAATQNVSTSQSQPILAQIATSRNIVEKVLTPPESCLPREINDLFLLLDRWLLKPHQRERKKVIPEVDKLHTYLDMMVISDMGKKVINDKLLTFGEWTDTWSDKSKEKMVVLDKIHECKEVMAKKLREEWSQVSVNWGPH
ncbi:hypothetical protein H0H93_009205 [Arthromyces matolae]|nr:hypothetical protein H0H93_009205 [Arthromyces matolae]